RLTHDAYDDRNAAWSPDGTRLAFSSDRTAYGEEGAYNLFTLDLSTGEIAYVTSGPQMDLSPRWSPDGTRLVFVSSRREPDGHFSAQDLWVADLAPSPVATEATTSLPPAAGTTGSRADHGPREASGDSSVSAAGAPPVGPTLHRLTAFTGAAFDPVWTADDHVVFSTFEDYRFTVRTLSLDSLLADPHPQVAVRFPAPDSAWAFNRLEITDAERRRPYRRRYTLDIAAGNINNSPAYGASGGAVVAFSDVLGDDIFYVTAYSANTVGRSFLEGLSLGVTRIHLGRRANYGYGLFRMAGQRYDRTDPDAVASYPVYYEQVYGAVGLMEYPLTKFRRIELSTSIGWSRKDQLLRVDDELETVQFTNSLALVHDNALYGLNGPLDGWRASVAAGYSTDLLYSNVSFYSVSADVRRYFRITRDVTFASWGLGRFNVGRRARLNLLGGSWSLRGFPFLRLRGRNLWFTSHELRFPLVNNPSAVVPLLAPFGVVSLRGALFADAARLWNEGYDDVELDPGSGYHVGTTLGAVGAGLRLNLYGAFVLRYDRGYRFTDGLRWAEREPFSQFFFGWDF
ncbi:MAG TPA: BamA/TamA family outer membrane protein, partial [Rubricoccaceae bacterium]|nr:BamA/TamA family outer membrane protein [Rubricoccaceae bacterium]